MSEIKLPFTQNVGIIIAGVAVIVALSGYILYFKSQGRLHAQTKEFHALQEKFAEDNKALTTTKGKYDSLNEDLKRITQDALDSKQKYEECQQKINALQQKYETLKRDTVNSAAAAAAPAAATPAPVDAPAPAPADAPAPAPTEAPAMAPPADQSAPAPTTLGTPAAP